MPTVYAHTSDGYVRMIDSSWSDTRDATAGSEVNSTAQGQNQAVQASTVKGGQYAIARSFFLFNMSGVSGTVSEATLNLFGYIGSSDSVADYFVVKSTHATSGGTIALGTDDYDTITGWDTSTSADGNGAGDQESNVTKYSSEITSWSTSGYNSITLNAQARSDMVGNTFFAICVMNSTSDLRDITPTGGFSNAMFYANRTGVARDPKIVYTIATGYGEDIMGVASANIATVNGIATANISEVIGV